MNMHRHTSQGFANLMGILIITVIGMSLALTLLSVDTWSANELIARESFAQARANANTCTEGALFALYGNDEYSGEVENTFTRGECHSTTTNTIGGAGEREVLVRSQGRVQGTMLEEETTLTITHPLPELTPVFSRMVTREVE